MEEGDGFSLVRPTTVLRVVLPPGLEVFWSLALLSHHHGALLDLMACLSAIKTCS